MFRKFVVSLLATVAIGSAFTVVTVRAEEYPAVMVIDEVNGNQDLVVGHDFAGNIWSFYANGGEDWMVGDLCAMIMDDKETPLIYDDEIKATRYVGYVQ